VRIAVLGRLRAVRDGRDLELGPVKQRALLAGLVLHAGRVVPVETLTDLLWGDAPPAAVHASLHGYVAALRRVLEPGRAARSEPSVLLTQAPGYRLDLPADAVDASVFTREVTDVRRRLGGDPLQVMPGLRPAELDGLDERLATAMALWQGEPFPRAPGRPGRRGGAHPPEGAAVGCLLQLHSADGSALPASRTGLPGSLLFHGHDERLSALRQFGVMGTVVVGPGGPALRPERFVAGSLPESPLAMGRTVLRLRGTAKKYLAARDLPWPAVAWDELAQLQAGTAGR
jgi:hypothetical protein